MLLEYFEGTVLANLMKGHLVKNRLIHIQINKNIFSKYSLTSSDLDFKRFIKNKDVSCSKIDSRLDIKNRKNLKSMKEIES